jgi:hypothetical protein
MEGAGGLAAVSVGISPWLLLALAVVVLFGAWKLTQFFLALFR